MALLEPDETYGWHDAQTSWREVKVAVLLVLTIGLTAFLLF